MYDHIGGRHSADDGCPNVSAPDPALTSRLLAFKAAVALPSNLMILSRPVKPRASRIAVIVASVPELTRRTISSEGSNRHSVSANSTSSSVGAPNDRPSAARSCTARTTAGCAWPTIAGPQEPT